jgi:hypothetical protein
MRFKLSSVLWFSLAAVSLAQNRPASAFFPQLSPQQRQEHQEAKRQNFATGRQLLLDRGVPFDPDELLRDGWDKNLRTTLDSMPEMRESRYEKAPLQGAYLADTLYLPENVQLTGHTVIIAKYLVFEGKNPVIKGNFDLHFFPAKPVAVLGTSLASILQHRPGALNVKASGRMRLPSFALIKDLADHDKHVITFDTSGLPPESERRPSKKPVSSQRSAATTNASIVNVVLQSTITCTSSCDNNGAPGSTGQAGFSPSPSPAGLPSGGPQAPNGSCGGVANISGSHGAAGGAGPAGLNAGDGGPGTVGVNAGNINGSVADGDTNVYTFNAKGGKGGKGGPGGQGGQGGDGGTGQAGGNGAVCQCNVGNGGNGGQGGAAGPGGRGGNGGMGGNGGNGGIITVSIPFDGSVPITSVAGGLPVTREIRVLRVSRGIPGLAGQLVPLALHVVFRVMLVIFLGAELRRAALGQEVSA